MPCRPPSSTLRRTYALPAQPWLTRSGHRRWSSSAASAVFFFPSYEYDELQIFIPIPISSARISLLNHLVVASTYSDWWPPLRNIQAFVRGFCGIQARAVANGGLSGWQRGCSATGHRSTTHLLSYSGSLTLWVWDRVRSLTCDDLFVSASRGSASSRNASVMHGFPPLWILASRGSNSTSLLKRLRYRGV